MEIDTERGLYGKYLVERIDDYIGKHDDCPYFVLDIKHDPFARHALHAYIERCREAYPGLANDLEHLLRNTPLAQ